MHLHIRSVVNQMDEVSQTLGLSEATMRLGDLISEWSRALMQYIDDTEIDAEDRDNELHELLSRAVRAAHAHRLYREAA